MITDQCPLCKKKLSININRFKAHCIRGHYSLIMRDSRGCEYWNYNDIYIIYVYQNSSGRNNYTRIEYNGHCKTINYRIPPTKNIKKLISIL